MMLFKSYLSKAYRAAKVAYKNLKALKKFPTASYVVFVHDAHKHGAQLLALSILKDLKATKNNNSVVGILIGNGPLINEFQSLDVFYAPYCWNIKLLYKILSRYLPTNCTLIFNSLVTQNVAEYFTTEDRPSVALIHELPTLIKEYKLEELTKTVNSCGQIVFPSSYVKERFIREFSIEKPEKIRIIQQGLYQRRNEQQSTGTMRKSLNIADSTFVVLNLAYGDLRKAPDLFIQTAFNYFKLYPDDDTQFIWAGNTDPKIHNWLEHDLEICDLKDKVRFIGFRTDVMDLLLSSDCFYLTSREDPFPSTVIEAYKSKKPIVLFNDGNGFIDIESKYFHFTEYLDTTAAAQTIHKIKASKAIVAHDDAELFYNSKEYVSKLINTSKEL